MRVLVEGPKFSGKSTLIRQLSSAYPTSTRLEVRCFFDRTIELNQNTKYYSPRESTIKTLSLFLSAFQSIPEADEIIIERFHLFDWVHRSATIGGSPISWENYKKIDHDLLKLKFKIILLIPPWKCLSSRAKSATNQHISIPHEILMTQFYLYQRVIGFTKLPVFIMQEEYTDIEQILKWIQSSH